MTVTHGELQVILEAKAQGAETVTLPVETPNGTWDVQFCGTCGRIVHHPDCPRVVRP